MRKQSRKRVGRWPLWVLGIAISGLLALALIVGVVNQRSDSPSGSGPVVRLAPWSGGGFLDLANPNRPLVVFAMAGWCATCLPVAEQLQELHEQLSDSPVEIVAMSIDPTETEERLREFWLAAGRPTYLWGFDDGGRAMMHFRIAYLDTILVVSPDGEVLLRKVRPANDAILEALSRFVVRKGIR